ncbi:MAG: HAMP domain-containing histidine kinase [Ruminococcus sp.]|nr:HAMP domain-containing histidine kinase [Ruminococcus sp.]
MMRSLAFRPPELSERKAPDNMPEPMPENIRLPFFKVNISENGEITTYGNDYYFTDRLDELVKTVNQSDEEYGIITEYDLRFMKSANNRTIVFADVSSEKAMMKGLVRNSIVTGAVGYVIFFVISLILAKWVTKPVEKTWNEQKQFIADASHELKTPLTVIITNAEMMSDKNYTEDDRENFTRNILSTSKRMRGLVESLLELARLDNSNTQIKKEKFDFSSLVNDCILPFEPLFYENNTELSADIEENTEIDGDRDKLRQVAEILLDNALKYSDPADKVTITLKKQSGNCILSVSGLGTPLSKEECQNIFKRFYRVDKSRNNNGSYGLGLSIAKSIIEGHGGKIWAESVNGYNIFTVSLPL